MTQRRFFICMLAVAAMYAAVATDWPGRSATTKKAAAAQASETPQNARHHVDPSPEAETKPSAVNSAAEVPENPSNAVADDSRTTDTRSTFSDRWRAALAVHDEQPTHAAWARPMAADTSATLAELAKDRKFSFDFPDCRTNSCSVSVEWPDYHTAEEAWDGLIHIKYPMNCATMISLPKPDREDEAYRTRLLLKNCQPWKE